MVGAGATSKTDNYVGLWCHGGAQEDGSDFRVKIYSHTKAWSYLPFARAKDLRLNDPSCGATEDGKNFYLQTADKCGTTTTKTGSTITYSNKVLGRPLVNKAVISRIRDIGITFSCSYPREKDLSPTSNIHPNNKTIDSSIQANGKFNFSLKLFPTDKFTNPYTKYPVSIYLRQLVYVEVAVRSVKKELSVLAQQCYATPSSNGAIPKHWLIKDSCPADPTLKILNSPTKNVQRFSFETFKFTANDKDIYVHCHVIACNAPT
ncbi:hypothetical protein QZH41_006512 [Actinostola sp. cb2023]|nr:hypothetical protein QZH41_006512 [Actinostola sp. cb2023]